MEKMAPVGRRFPSSCISKGDDHPSQSPKSAVRETSAVPMQPRIHVCIVLIFATNYLSMISAQGSPETVAQFNVSGTSYDCFGNIICLGQAHVYTGYGDTGIEVGRLSLLNETSHAVGIAYYSQPVKFLDLQSHQAASFSTSFTMDVRIPVDYDKGSYEDIGSGMTFVISADKSFIGSNGGLFGIYDNVSNSTTFRSIVVDFMNIEGKAPVDAMAINMLLTDNATKYAWVDYSTVTQLLEVRVSYNNSKPIKALSSCAMNLFDMVDEIMWVGFTSASRDSYGNFYIGNWSFESYWIPSPSPVPFEFPYEFPPEVPIEETPTTSGTTSQSKLGVTLGTTGGILAVISCTCACVRVFLIHLSKSDSSSDSRDQPGRPASTEDDQIQLEGMPQRFSYNDLSNATKAFSEEMKLGQGGFGSVYRGVLPSSGIPVAVKKINSDSNQGEKEFLAEISIISQLRHRNLIQLHGWCKDAAREKYLLVYELMPNGSLDKVLFEPADSQSACLSWAQRFNIVTGTAAALDYLHQGWKQQVIHRDIKSSNIMLDQEWNTKLGDFGLARFVDRERAPNTTVVAGTFGYIAPEAAATGRFTDKTDVFAFGAVLLEIACGRKAFSHDVPPEEYFLVDWVWHNFSQRTVLNTVDRRLAEYDTHSITMVLMIGLACSHPDPQARLSMRQVVQVLAGDAPVPSIPASKPAPVFSSDPRNISIDSVLNQKSGTNSKPKSGPKSLVHVS